MARDDAAKLRALYRREDAELAALEQAADELRVAYDHYFLGIEKREPQKARAELERGLRRSQLFDATRATVRFRFSTLRHRVATYATYWDRTLRQIEEGTFRREGALRRPGAMRAPAPEIVADAVEDAQIERAEAPSEAALAAAELLRALGHDAPELPAPPEDGRPADAPPEAPPAPSAPAEAPAPSAPPRLGPPPLPRAAGGPPPLPPSGGPPPVPRPAPPRPHDDLYRQFVAARRANNEGEVSYEAFKGVVERSARPGASVTVAVKDGKATLVIKKDA